jgi:hypothetical protein
MDAVFFFNSRTGTDLIMHRPIDRDAEFEPDIASDRCRLGRPNDVRRALIPLLHGTATDDLHAPQADAEPDQLASARGIVVWVLISVVLWGLLFV